MTGVKYDLLEWPEVPKSLQAHKVIPAKLSAKGEPQDTKVHARAKESAVENSAIATVVKFPNSEDDADGASAEVEEIKDQVRLAMKALEEGKQVAAFNLLKRIIDS